MFQLYLCTQAENTSVSAALLRPFFLSPNVILCTLAHGRGQRQFVYLLYTRAENTWQKMLQMCILMSRAGRIFCPHAGQYALYGCLGTETLCIEWTFAYSTQYTYGIGATANQSAQSAAFWPIGTTPPQAIGQLSTNNGVRVCVGGRQSAEGSGDADERQSVSAGCEG